MSSLANEGEWSNLLHKLGMSNHFVENSVQDLSELQKGYEKHVCDQHPVSHVDRCFLMLAANTCKFLRKIRHRAIPVEGDKGKLVGL